MTFRLSQRSKDNLRGVNPKLVAVVEHAILLTEMDFAVIEGVRTTMRQAELVKAGASQTMASKHVEGKAVDLMAYLNGRASWELSLYDEIATAVRQAAIEKDVAIRWGAAWNIPDIRNWRGTMEEAMNFYVDARRKEGKRPFIDAPHFEMM